MQMQCQCPGKENLRRKRRWSSSGVSTSLGGHTGRAEREPVAAYQPLKEMAGMQTPSSRVGMLSSTRLKKVNIHHHLGTMRCVKSTSGIWICISTLAIHLVESDLNLFSSSAPRDEVHSIPLTLLCIHETRRDEVR